MQFKDLLNKVQGNYSYPVMIARVGNQYHELSDEYNGETNVEFLDTSTSEGMLAYRKSLTFIMVKAMHDIRPDISVRIMFSLGNAVYVEANKSMANSLIDKLSDRMIEIIKADYVFNKKVIPTTSAITSFNCYKMYEKAEAFSYRRVSTTNVYDVDGFENYFYGDLAYSTGCLSHFSLQRYHSGFLLVFPTTTEPLVAEFINNYDKLYSVLKTTSDWSSNIHVRSAGELNNVIVRGQINELILEQEAVMENDIAKIVQDIIDHNKKIVLIAGPSSSGKTSFSNRLAIQLKTHGYNAHPIACDDYFVDRDTIPFGPDGKQNLEDISIVDLTQLEKDINGLKLGQIVEIPHFNFVSGKREYHGNYLKLDEKDIIIMEGIHCLNPIFLPNSDAYRIYISALPVLNLDGHNYISSSNSRLLRRIARDARHRGTSAQNTIGLWNSVRQGEETNIFPYQENADAIFNSSLIYEIPILKTTVEPLLFAVDRNSEEWATAKTLLKFLDFFLGWPGNEVPHHSLLREFMGGSCFNVG